MYGKSVSAKYFLVLLIQILFSLALLEPSFAQSNSQKATVLNEDTLVYKKDDFDAEVLATVQRGEIYSISKKAKGPFYKIRLKPGKVGWISDADIKLGEHKNLDPKPEQVFSDTKSKKKKKKGGEEEEEFLPFEDAESMEENRSNFLAQRYRGLALESVMFTEDTMGARRKENVFFYGPGWSGYNTLFDAELYTTAQILFHWGAPDYYKTITGESASGYIIKPHFLFETVFRDTENMLMYYGFGPSMTFSHFETSLAYVGGKSGFTTEDMNIGAVFSIGAAFRFKSFSPRIEFKYYWENVQYYGINLSLLGLF